MAIVADSLDLDSIDIATPAVYQHAVPFAAFELLRREAPVYWYERPGFEPFWAITKYQDIAWIDRNPKIFSSSSRLSLADIDHLEMRNARLERRAAETGCPFDKPPDLLFMDPPLHRDHRSIISRNFSPRNVARYEEELRGMARQYVSEFSTTLASADGAPVNAVQGLAGKLPVTAICLLMGVPADRLDDVERWINTMFGHRVKTTADAEQAARGAEGEYLAYMRDLMERRRTEPRDDLISKLVHAVVDGQSLTDGEVLDHVRLLFGAGYDTTRNASTMGLNALLRHPAELRKLVADPTLVPTAVEEVLRWTSPVIEFSRVCKEDTEIRGQRIRKGETVVMYYVSANRDEEMFADPKRFDITRDPNPHMAFGGGEHFCLGANLARLELRMLFEALPEVLPRLELVGQPTMVPNSLITHSVERLPVRLQPVPAP